MANPLRRLFRPRAVAVIGATESPNKPGRIVVEQLKQTEIQVYPVHPTKKTVLGLSVYSSIELVPERPDIAVVAVSAKAAVPAVEACVACAVPFVIVLAGGFGETDDAGRELETQLAQSVTGSKTRILGPNTLGVLCPENGFDTIFVEHAVAELSGKTTVGAAAGGSDGVAFVSQSGSVAVEALGSAALHGLPLNAFVGLGNAIDLQAKDFVDHFASSSGILSLALYLEHLGEGRGLLESASVVASRIPVFLLKAGRTKAGAVAVASHTGRLAGSDAVVDGALAQYGIQRVEDDEELIDALRAVSYANIPTGNRVAIVTCAGGYGVMGADYIERTRGLRALCLAQFADKTDRALKSAMLPFASAHNPVDLTAGADTSGFLEAVKIVLSDPGVDIVIVYAFFAPAGISDDLVEGIAECAKGSNKTVLVFAHSGTKTDEYCRRFTAAGVASYPALDRTIRAAGILVERSELRRRHNNAASPLPSVSAGQSPQPRILEEVGTPDEARTKDLLERYDVPTPPRMVLAPDDELSSPPFSGPYAVKASAAGLTHKTDLGALRLGVEEAQLAEAVYDLRARFGDAAILVEQMVGDIDVELIVGAIRDPDLGPAIMLGAGGVLAELYRDTSFRLIPAPRSELLAMTTELRVSPLFAGFRGIDADRNALVDVLEWVSALVFDIGEPFAELDVNPLAFAGGEWLALDAKLTLRE